MAPLPAPSQEEEDEDEETLTLLVLAGVTSLPRVQALVASFVASSGQQQQVQPKTAAPDLVLALGPFALEENEEEQGKGMERDLSTPPPPWRPAPLDLGTVEGRAAAEADATAVLALLEIVVCRLVYCPAAGLDPPSTISNTTPQLTLTSLNAHAAVAQLLPGLYIGGFAHGTLDKGVTDPSERATQRTLAAAGRLCRGGSSGGQLIMLETFPSLESGRKQGPFSLSPAFLARAGGGDGCRLLLHVGYVHPATRSKHHENNNDDDDDDEEEEGATEKGESGSDHLPCAARYEQGADGLEGPTLLAPACFGGAEGEGGGSFAVVRLGKMGKGGGRGLWTVRDVRFERVW